LSPAFGFGWFAATSGGLTQDGHHQVLTNPADDGAFRRNAYEALPLHPTPAGLEAALREQYAEATIRARELTSEAIVVW